MIKQNLFFLAVIISLCLQLTKANAQQQFPVPYSNNVFVNYIRTWEAKAPQTDPTKILVTSPLDSFVMTTQYLDGLGRPIQTVAKGITPSGKDLVTPTVYDAFGREQFKYLPFAANNTGNNISISDGFFKLNPFQQDSTFYNSNNSVSPIKGQGETFLYSQAILETSPLNRVTNNYAPGNSWIGNSKGIGQQYLFNTTNDSVRIWIVGTNASDIPTTSASYNAGQLYKNITTDENLTQVVEYKDKEGKVILKKVQLSGTPGTAHMGWLCTYYVYDDLGNLRFVLQPKAVETLLSNGDWTITTAIRDELCFYYGYDARNRMTIKKVPGAGEVYMAYDARDRICMTQDANMRTNAQWLVTLYDALNRPIQSGLVTNSSIGSKTFSQHLSDAYSEMDYPFTAWNTPLSGYEMLTQTGYDSYDSIPNGAPNGSLATTYITSTNFYTSGFNTSLNQYAQQVSQSNQTRGLTAWTKVKVLGTTSTYLYSVSIYDDKARVVQVKSTNYSGGVDTLTTQYGFAGRVLRTHVAHQKSGINPHRYYVLTKNSYDVAGRMISVSKRANIDNGTNTTDKTIAQMSYDETGQLKKKVFGSALDSMEYDYNIRGWMLGTNRDYAKSTNATAHYFGFDLGYDKTGISPNGGSLIGSYTVNQLNGNIAGMVWKSTGDQQIRKYDFTYDAVNRLTGADFSQYTSSAFNKTAGLDFSVTGLTYDANGNILTMNQKGWKVTGNQTIDSLQYNYYTNSNRLMNVIDRMNDVNTRLGDFRASSVYMNLIGSKGTSTVDYTYDANGNLSKDLNKDIGTSSTNGITYNLLNLPGTITVTNKGTISYVYDALGNKLQKTTTEGSKVTTTLYTFGNYVNDTLQYLPQEEGRIRFNSDSSKLEYDYFIKDHLGNVRMVLTEAQKTDGYPSATMEMVDSAINNKYYSNITSTRTLVSGINNYPTDNSYSNPNQYVAKVNGSGNKIGPAIILKVMAGDKFNVRVSDWYNLNGSSPQTPYNPVTDLVTALATSIGGVSGSKGTPTELTSSGILNPGIFSYYGSHNNSDSTTKPKAFLNWVAFDEQMNYVASSSGFMQVGASNQEMVTPLQQNGISIIKNGYFYVYVSNETPNIDVYFDNLQVTHTRGPILEDQAYYPFGLTMQGISSETINFADYKPNCGCQGSKKGYNGNEIQQKEFEDGTGLELYDFNARTYDHQIGRFIQIDPLVEVSQEKLSPYQFGFDNPVLYNDPDGKCPICPFLIPALEAAADALIAAYVSYKVVDANKENIQKMTDGINNYLHDKLNKNKSDNSSGSGSKSNSTESPSSDYNDGESTFIPSDVKSYLLYTKSKEAQEQSENGEAKGGTYVLKDKNTGKVDRSGRTKDLTRREKEHAKDHPDKQFEVDKRTDDYNEQRGREQQLHENHKPPLNKIKPIRDNNPKKSIYEDAAKKFLDSFTQA